MNNNDIFKKLRVALQLRDDQIVEILELVDFRMSKGEVGNFFRTPDHEKYVECGDQVLRNFLNGLVIHLRGTKENPKNPREVLDQDKPLPKAPAKGIAPKSETSGKPFTKTPAKNFTKKAPGKKAPAKKSPVENVKYTIKKKN